MQQLNEIIKACLKQDTRAEYALYTYCYKIMIRICRRYAKNTDEAIELMNLSFLKIIQNLDKFQQDKSFESWAKTVTVNTILDEFRKKKSFQNLFQTTDLDNMPEAQLPIDLNTAEEDLHANEILLEIQKLPEGSKQVLNLFVFEGYSHAEIARELKISESTSRWHLANARNLLKNRISDLIQKLNLYIL